MRKNKDNTEQGEKKVSLGVFLSMLQFDSTNRKTKRNGFEHSFSSTRISILAHHPGIPDLLKQKCWYQQP